MVLPTRVNVINDSSEWVKIKINNDRDRKVDEIVNIEPGQRYETSGSVSSTSNNPKKRRWDVVIDIITNPEGSGNNEEMGTFRFDNPFLGPPKCSSRKHQYISARHDIPAFGPRKLLDGLTLDDVYARPSSLDGIQISIDDKQSLKTYWATWPENSRTPNSVFTNRLPKRSEELYQSILTAYSEANQPIIAIEAFMHDVGAKNWDLRIASDGFLPSASQFDGFA